ncbi:hypothetical protein GRX03_00890 [Halovenus sp. WSH3]|uniref:Uncharacterized protein n=1 Tax=Halovenus carboxidivorans TaxID=2692199 RepID=A0A6B0T1R3_9EURY|nr:hypothetical protein [Halovenus carboxidivorans]MXR50166.1 hypothetical protein [Halovenus carboxidivorans]
MATETVTVTIETEDAQDELEVPVDAIDLLNESDEGVPTVLGDLALLGVAQQVHGIIHHTQEEVGEDVEAAEEKTMELFEERFGQSFADMVGHDH